MYGFLKMKKLQNANKFSTIDRMDRMCFVPRYFRGRASAKTNVILNGLVYTSNAYFTEY